MFSKRIKTKMIKVSKYNTLILQSLRELDKLNRNLIIIYKTRLKNCHKFKMIQYKKLISILNNKKIDQTQICLIIKNAVKTLMIGYINLRLNQNKLRKNKRAIESLYSLQIQINQSLFNLEKNYVIYSKNNWI